MDERTRLELIAEAVRYCQRVRVMGMPVAAYTKALREPIHFLWERRGGRGKDRSAQFRSRATIGVRRSGGVLRYDHAVPFRYLQEDLLSLGEVSPASVRSVLDRHAIVVLITKEENDRLNSLGLASRMPGDWNGSDPFARYAAAGINLVPNTDD